MSDLRDLPEQNDQFDKPHPLDQPGQSQPQSADRPDSQLDSSSPLPANSGIDAPGPGHVDPEDLALYAMQFIDGEQADSIAAHLTHCDACRSELALIHGDLAATALTTELESPTPAARQRFLAQIAHEKQAAHQNQIAQENKVVPIAPTNKQAESPAESAQPPLASFGRKGSILNPIEEERPKRRVGLGIFAGLGWAAAAALAFFAFTLYKDTASLRGTIASRAGEVETPQCRGRLLPPASRSPHRPQGRPRLPHRQAAAQTLTHRRRHLQPRKGDTRLPRQQSRPAPVVQGL